MLGLLELENHNAIKPVNRVKKKNIYKPVVWTVPLVELYVLLLFWEKMTKITSLW
jgi:hypothetical protein